MTVRTPSGSWLVPPHRAVWIPAEFKHALQMTGKVQLKFVYIRPDLAVRLPSTCCVIVPTPLLRELIVEIVRIGLLRDNIPEHNSLTVVLLRQIDHTRRAPLQIRMPLDPRARRVADKVVADLSTDSSIAELSQGTGAGKRTIERLFTKETGLTFGRWLQHVKAIYALERLVAGDSVTEAGLAVGYDSTSAFIAMFKRVFGTTPGKYMTDNPPAHTDFKT